MQPGDLLGPYSITGALGAGAMGEVYRARDTKLQRDVAIKVLPAAFTADPERLARFEREARALASLNHPHIAQIYGFEHVGDVRALVMELVEGETLADRLQRMTSRSGQRSGMPMAEALGIALQIADALDTAHEKGIVHRDLKPANVMITPAGAVKVLDFGLAKTRQHAAAADATHAATVTAAPTEEGLLLGTIPYMSPEQARGQTVDKRTDVWALGCLLYEMLTGKRAFRGATKTDVLAAILEREPDWTALPKATPSSIERLLRRCLDKDMKRRMRDIADARLELEEALAAPAAEPAPVTAPARGARQLWIGIGVAAGIALGVASALLVAGWLRPVPEPAPLARFVLEAPPKELGGASRLSNVAITRDGSVVVYDTGALPTATLRTRRLDQLEGAPLRGAEPGAVLPFLSPDDRWVGYAEPSTLTLRKISILGGPSVTLCSKGIALIQGASWGLDDTIVFGQTSGPLRRVAASGGEPQDLTQLAEGEVAHRFPEFLPGGEALLFAAFESNDPKFAAIHALSLATGERKLVLAGATQPRYAASGHLVYAVGPTLFAVAFDPRRLEVAGDPVLVVEGVGAIGRGSSRHAVSASGALVYVMGGATEAQHVLVWVDREGREEPIGAPPRFYVYPRLSPDGTKIALDVREGEEDIWIWDLGRETLMRLTISPGTDAHPVWSPDGRTIFFGSEQEDGSWDLVGRLADGTGEARRLTGGRGFLAPTFVTADGDGLVVGSGSLGGATDGLPGSPGVKANMVAEDILWVDATGKAEPRTLLDARSVFQNAALSPDGRWLAYESNESGKAEIFVRPFPALDSGHWQVSTGGGTRPLWSRDGREIFYLDASSFLTAVAVERRDDALSFGRPEVVIGKAYVNERAGRTYDVSPDGRRFLMIKAVSQEQDDTAGRIVLVQNWLDELRRLAPARGH